MISASSPTDGSMLILPESVDVQHTRKEALSCDENEDKFYDA